MPDDLKDVEFGDALEDLEEEQPKSQATESFRYACESCTGIAYYTDGESAGHPAGITHCRNCGSQLGSFQPENLIPLNETEKESLRALQ